VSTRPHVARPQVFTFPIAAPPGAVVRDDLDAVSHLALCLTYQRHWCEHKPSVTITVRDGEWGKVGEWVYSHFDELAGVSFLPHDMGTYKQTPYEAVPEATFRAAAAAMPRSIDWRAFWAVERGARDHAVGRDLACSSGECEVVGEEIPGERRAVAEAQGAAAAASAAAAAGDDLSMRQRAACQ
jgi:ribonucleoside-triphosphate reductase (thioredoxin)